jgi:maleylpyruvate isomerase
MELYNYFRSSASYRVRIALALKGLDYDYKPVHLAKNEQFTESYAAVSAARLVPLLRDGENLLTQSLAIIEYLEETHPEPPLLPADAGRPRPGACPGAGHRLRDPPAEQPARAALPGAGPEAGEDDKNRWYRHWVETGLETVERQLAARPPPTATATAHAWPTACWCRRSSTHGASSAGWTTCPRSCVSSTLHEARRL